MQSQNNEIRILESLSNLEKKFSALEKKYEELDQRVKVIEDSIPGKEILTLEEASQYLGQSMSQMYKMTRTCTFPHYKPMGKFIYVNRNEMIAWAQKNPIKTKEAHELDAVAYVSSKPLKNIC